MASHDTAYTVVLKQLSSSNWEYERDHCTEVLRTVDADFQLEVDDVPAGRRNRHRNSGYTLVAHFKEEPSTELVAEMRWRIHNRHL